MGFRDCGLTLHLYGLRRETVCDVGLVVAPVLWAMKIDLRHSGAMIADWIDQKQQKSMNRLDEDKHMEGITSLHGCIQPS